MAIPRKKTFALRALVATVVVAVFGSARNTSAVTLAQFAPIDSLNAFWLYADSTINTGTGFETATHGKVGAGDSVTGNSNDGIFHTTTQIRGNLNFSGPSAYFDSALYVHGRANFRTAVFHGTGSSIQIDGSFNFANNNGYDTAVLWLGGATDTIQSTNSVLAKPIHVAGNVYCTNSFSPSSFLDTVYYSPTTAFSGSCNLSAIPKKSQIAYVAGIPTPAFYDSTRLPGYNAKSWFSIPASRSTVGGKDYPTGICATGCSIYPGISYAGKTLRSKAILPAGYYGRLSLDNDTVILGEGIYYFDNIAMSNTSLLVAYQPTGSRTIIYSDSGIDVSASGFIGPDSAYIASKFGVTSSAADFGGGTMMLVVGSHSNMSIGASNVTFWATLSAPTGTISLNSGDTLYGQVFARHFRATNNFTGGSGQYIPFYPTTPTVTITKFNATVTEKDTLGNIGTPDTSFANFALSMDHINGQAVTIWYHTVDSTATSTGTWSATSGKRDYVPVVKDSVVIPATALSGVITIKVLGDLVAESTEYFKVVLDSSRYGSLGTAHADSVGVGTIIDNDKRPTLRVTNTAIYEGNSGTTIYKFVVKLVDSATGGAYAGTLGYPIAYEWKTFGITAFPPSDYNGVSWTWDTIPVGSTTDTIKVSVNGDKSYEPDETFRVVVDSATLASQISATSIYRRLSDTGTIKNDDSMPRVVVRNASVTEGNSGLTTYKLVVKLVNAQNSTDTLDSLGAPGVPVKYHWYTLDSTAGHTTGIQSSADSLLYGSVTDTDYVKQKDTTRTILAGHWTDTISIQVRGDTKYENNEYFKLILVPLDSALKSKGNDTAVVTILNDDTMPVLSVTGTHQKEGDTLTSSIPFVVHLNAASGVPVVYTYATADGTGSTTGATVADNDYVAKSGKDTIKAGNTTDTIWVTIKGDRKRESNETFTLTATVVSGATATILTATDTIVNDDSMPTISVTGTKLFEGSAGGFTRFPFVVKLSSVSGLDVTFNYATSDSTAGHSSTGAIPDSDYTATSGTATIAAGSTVDTIWIPVVADTRYENDEYFRLTISNITGATGLITSTLDTILNDDSAPTVTATGVAKYEGSTGGTTPFPVVVKLSSVSGLPVIFTYATSDGTATIADSDYTTRSGKDTIKVGSTVDTIWVSVKGDTKYEANEYFNFKLTTISGSSTASASAVDTILNDDSASTITVKGTKLYEGKTGDTTLFPFVVTLNSASGLAATYTYTTADGTTLPTTDSAARTSDKDYVGVTTSITRTIAAGTTTDTVKIKVIGDNKYEADEVFTLNVTPTSGITTTGSVLSAVDTILNDDSLPKFSIDSATVQEPAKSTDPDSTLTFTIKLSAASGVTTTVKLGQSNSTSNPATPDQSGVKYDYAPPFSSDTTLTFAPGETSKTITVKVHGDSIFEGTIPETFYLYIKSTNVYATINAAADSGLGSIKDNDPPPVLHLDTVTVNEGATATITASLSAASSLPVTFTWTTKDHTALAGYDYTYGTATVTFAVDPLSKTTALSKTLSIATRTDSIANEGLEDFYVIPSSLVNATLGDTGLVKITDMTPKPQISISDAIDTEGQYLVFHIHLSDSSATPLSLTWKTYPDSDVDASKRAVVGVDYKDTSAALVLRAGLRDTVVKVRTIDNTLDEADSMYLKVLLSKATASDATLGFLNSDSTGIGIILDNDNPPTVSVNSVSLQEPADSGKVAWMVFTFSLSSASGKTVSASWATKDSTARSDSDYVAKVATVAFPAGTTSVKDSVAILGDNLYEGTEYFKLQLSSPANATLGTSTGVGTILDNDNPPTLSIGDVINVEPNDTLNGAIHPDSILYNFKVVLSHTSGKNVTFLWQTANYGGSDSATAGLDYKAVSATTVTIPAGNSVAILPVWVYSDEISEVTEYFNVLLSKVTSTDGSFTFFDSLGLGTIKDANGRPRVTINDTGMTEATGALNFTVSLSNKSSTDVKIYFHTVDQTATGGAAYAKGIDYRNKKDSVIISAGSLTKTLGIWIFDDSILENTETFKVVLDSTDSLTSGSLRLPSANIIDSGVGTIVDNDTMPRISVVGAVVPEPADSGDSVALVVTFKLSIPSGLVTYANWTTQDSTAKAGLDYIANGGTVRFNAGETLVKDTVWVLGDDLYEGTEYFHLNLSAPVNGKFKDSVGVGTILDSDSAPHVSIDDATVREGETAKFTIRLDSVSALPVVVKWFTLSGTATSGLDYDTAWGTDTIAAGNLVEEIKIHVSTRTDSISGEGTETFTVHLSNLVSARAGDTVGTGFIVDATPLPSISIDSIGPFVEADSTVYFTVTLGNPSAVDVHITFGTHNVNTTPGKRYVDTTGTLTIPAGQTTATIAVKILDDSIREPNAEYFTMVLNSVDSGLLVHPIGLATILDDGDQTPVVVTNADTVTEGGVANFSVLVKGSTKDTVSVYWHTVSGTAIAGVDFQADSGVVILLPGQISSGISIRTYTDSVWEHLESFGIRIDSISKGSLYAPLDSVAKGWIRDANGAPTVSFLSPDTSVWEDTSDSVPVVVHLTGYSSVPVKVRVAYTGGTATPGVDYTVAGLSGDTITIAAGSLTATFKIHVIPDDIDEPNETASWTLVSSDSILAAGKTSYTLTILDDDSATYVRVVKDTQLVGEGDSVRVRFHLTALSGKDVSAWFHVAGTATSGVDDDLVSGEHYRLTFLAGSDTASILVHTFKDNLYEPTETALFVLDSASNAGILSAHAVDTVSILDGDGIPTVTFADTDTTVSEGVGTVTITLHLSHASSVSETVGIHAIQGTATLDSVAKGSDVALDTSTLYTATFAPGSTTSTFSFHVIDDGRVESTESFRLKLVAVDSLRLGGDLAVHIKDNDSLPAIVITSPAEGAVLGFKDLDGVGKVLVSWTLNGVVETPYDTLLKEGPDTITKCYTDTAGNTGCDTVHVTLDLTPPTVLITQLNSTTVPQPDTSIHLVNTVDDTIYWTVIDNGVPTKHVLDTTLSEGLHTIVRTACDAVGNCGSDTIVILVDTTPPTVTIVTPTNGDTLPSPTAVVHWTVTDNPAGTAYDISVSKVDTTILSHYGWNTITRCATDSAGNKACASVDVYLATPSVTSAYYLDANTDGKVDEAVLIFNSGWLGGTDTALTFSFLLDGEVRTGTISSVSGGKVVVKLDSAFSYGLTSTDSKDLGSFTITTTYTTATGATAATTASQSFQMADSVAPVILSATIGRTESYTGKDTLYVTTSEPINLSSGSDWLQVYRCKDGQPTCDASAMAWVTVPADSVHHDTASGRYYILIDTAATGTVRPNLQIRFVQGVSDISGNATDTAKQKWTAVVTGNPRPDVVVLTVPGIVTEVPTSEQNRTSPGAILIKATSGTNGSKQWWSSQDGYNVDPSTVSSACPDTSWCAGPTVEINRPVRMILYIYDHQGIYAISSRVQITQADIDAMKTDKLDRVYVELDWNYRTAAGRLVGSGVYLWRIVSYVEVEGRTTPEIANHVYKLGLKIK